MNIKKYIPWIITSLGLFFIALAFYKTFFYKEPILPYITHKPQHRTIVKAIDTTGKISVAEKIKIGSLVTGIIKKLYVDENETVKKGQPLAIIDTGKDDTDVRYYKGLLEKNYAQYQYQKNYYERQKSLYTKGQLAKNTFEQITRDYVSSKADYEMAQANYDKAEQEYNNTTIFAPQDGIVINVGIAEGERVTTDLDATVLFEIARDITKMEASLEIDESDIGNIKVRQKVEFTVDSFPQKTFKTKIKEISYSPKKKAGNLYYKAIIPVDNSAQLLRPGLSIDAKILIAKAKKALTLPTQAFMVSSKVLQEIANDLQYSFNPVDKKEYKRKKRSLEQQSNNEECIPTENLETIWVTQSNGKVNSFVEKIIKTNVSDDIYVEVTSGLSDQDDVIVDVEESDYMEEILKKAFSAKF